MLKLKNAIQRYRFDENSDIDDSTIDHLLDLALQTINSNSPRADIVKSLPREKKVLMIKQVMGQPKYYSNSKGPRYYVDLICQATCSQLVSGKTKTEQFIDALSRSITGTKQLPPLKDIIMELKVQCQCQSTSLIIF